MGKIIVRRATEVLALTNATPQGFEITLFGTSGKAIVVHLADNAGISACSTLRPFSVALGLLV